MLTFRKKEINIECWRFIAIHFNSFQFLLDCFQTSDCGHLRSSDYCNHCQPVLHTTLYRAVFPSTMYLEHVRVASHTLAVASLVVRELTEASLEAIEVEEVVQAVLELLVESALTKNLSVEGTFLGEKEVLSVDVSDIGEEDVEVIERG